MSRTLRAARDALVLYGCVGALIAGHILAWWMPAILETLELIVEVSGMLPCTQR